MKKNMTIPNYRQLYDISEGSPRISLKTETAILSLINRNTIRKEKPSLTKFFRYHSSLRAAVLVFLFIPLAATLLFMQNSSSKVKIGPMIVISDGSGTVRENEQLYFGYKIRKGDTLDSGNEQISIQRGNTFGIQMFEDSSLTMAGAPEKQGPLYFILNKGSMYINKKGILEQDRNTVIDIRNYSFTLIGTRVYFSLTADNSITVVCFEGRVQIDRNNSKNNKNNETIGLLNENEKAVISEAGEISFLYGNDINEAEKYIDSELSGSIPFSKRLILPELSDKNKAGYKIIDTEYITQSRENPEERTLPGLSGLSAHTDKKEVLPEYLITRIGVIPGGSLNNSETGFYSNAVIDDTAYLISDNSLVVLKDNSLTAIDILPDDPHFRIKPFVSEKYLGLASTKNIYLINRDDLSLSLSAQIPGRGMVADNYAPEISDNQIIVPVLNNGYYRLDLNKINSGLELLHQEVFPVSPTVVDNGVLVGSFYNNYISKLDKDGKQIWNYSLEGSSFSNFLVDGEMIFAYVLENDVPYIIMLENNSLKKRWKLNNTLVSDFGKYNDYIFGIDTEGRLFILDTEKDLLSDICEVFSKQLSTRALRNISPVLINGLLTVGTDTGKLLLYDPESGIVEEIIIDESEEFYTNAFAVGNSINLISNNGILYSVTKSGK